MVAYYSLNQVQFPRNKKISVFFRNDSVNKTVEDFFILNMTLYWLYSGASARANDLEALRGKILKKS